MQQENEEIGTTPMTPSRNGQDRTGGSGGALLDAPSYLAQPKFSIATELLSMVIGQIVAKIRTEEEKSPRDIGELRRLQAEKKAFAKERPELVSLADPELDDVIERYNSVLERLARDGFGS